MAKTAVGAFYEGEPGGSPEMRDDYGTYIPVPERFGRAVVAEAVTLTKNERELFQNLVSDLEAEFRDRPSTETVFTTVDLPIEDVHDMEQFFVRRRQPGSEELVAIGGIMQAALARLTDSTAA